MDLIDRKTLLRKLFPYEVVDKKNCAINAYAVEKAILDMPNKADSKEVKKAIDYLEKVLEKWTEFCNQHPPFANAIETLLEVVKDDT
jgi:hypothetical protein